MTIAFLVISAAVSSAPAQGFERVVEGVSFTLKCFGLMITDPAQHVEVCNPVFQNNPYESSMTSGDGGAVAPPTTPSTPSTPSTPPTTPPSAAV